MMQLIGMLDSPYVRRLAICMTYLEIPFEHHALSVFSDFDHFQKLNPAVKAPTVVIEPNHILMDSTVILQYLESTLTTHKTLWSKLPERRLLESEIVCCALAACDKSVQYIYEKNLRPENAQHLPWLDRVKGQIEGALARLESLIPADFNASANHANIMAAITFQFCEAMLPNVFDIRRYSQLALSSEYWEKDSLFVRFPPEGPGVNP